MRLSVDYIMGLFTQFLKHLSRMRNNMFGPLQAICIKKL